MALLEREAELAAVERELDLLRAAATGAPHAGRAGVLAFTGADGLGKTAVLRALAARAAARGCTVLYARGAEQERQSGFGTLRALLAPVRPLLGERTFRAAPGRVHRLAAPAVGLAAPACAVGPPPYRVRRALDRLVAHLATRSAPLVVLVDDAQWADPASLAWLTGFLPRVGPLPLLCAVAYDPATARPDLAGLRAVTESGTRRPHALDPLTAAGVRALVRDAYGLPGAGNDPGAVVPFAAECHTLTSGNPLALTHLLARARAAGLAPRPEALGSPASLAELARAEGAGFLDHLQSLGPDRVRLCWAVAVLGSAATLPLATRVAGLDAATAREAAAALRRAHVLAPPPCEPGAALPDSAAVPGAAVRGTARRGGTYGNAPGRDEPHKGETLAFAHSSYEGEVYRAIPAGLRTALHGQTAAMLTLTGGDQAAGARHLLEVHPDADPAVVAELRRAARSHAGAGAPEAAYRLLGRALGEPPARRDRPVVLYELAWSALRSGAPVAAAHHLRAALAEPSCGAGLRARATRVLALAERHAPAPHRGSAAVVRRPRRTPRQRPGGEVGQEQGAAGTR